MKSYQIFARICFLFYVVICMPSCQSQSQPKKQENPQNNGRPAPKDGQIGDYVVALFQDSEANLWFGTLEKGVAKFDGDRLQYFTTKDGLPSNRITSIVEDQLGNLWLGTGAGVSKYDHSRFTNYSEEDGLCNNMVSQLFIDSNATLWIGTWGGLCTFDTKRFEAIKLSYPKIDTRINPDTKDWITTITEDTNGNIWVGRDGYGASKINANTIVHYTTKEGLNSNNVQSIVTDKAGNIWFGTRVAEKDNPDSNNRLGKGGINKYDGSTFVDFPEIKGLHNNDVYGSYKDRENHLWFSTIDHGVYTYTNNEFVQHKIPAPTMAFLEDQKGTMWLGCAGGLYKIGKDKKVINVTTNGPWQ